MYIETETSDNSIRFLFGSLFDIICIGLMHNGLAGTVLLLLRCIRLIRHTIAQLGKILRPRLMTDNSSNNY